ncbi:MAG: hypothetical protein ACRDRY_22265 [Pseudonocardiaceae bacterium]
MSALLVALDLPGGVRTVRTRCAFGGGPGRVLAVAEKEAALSTELLVGLLLLFPATPWLAAWSMRSSAEALREREDET